MQNIYMGLTRRRRKKGGERSSTEADPPATEADPRRIVYPDGSYYQGDLKQGLRHGRGLLQTPNKTFMARWKNDQKHGPAKITSTLPLNGSETSQVFYSKNKLTEVNSRELEITLYMDDNIVPITDENGPQGRLFNNLRFGYDSGFPVQVFNMNILREKESKIINQIKFEIHNEQKHLCKNIHTNYVIQKARLCDIFVLVRDKKERILALACLGVKGDGSILEVYVLCTNQQIKKNGMGTFMISLIEEIGLNIGCRQVYLEAIESAFSFYLSLNYTSKNLIPMTKILDEKDMITAQK